MKLIDSTLIPSTGNQRIDHDHKNMAAAVNKIYEDWLKGVRCPDLSDGLEDLKEQLTRHFSMEATLARRVGYNSWLAHEEEHKGFLGKLNQFLAACRDGSMPGQTEIGMFTELEHHLFEHEVMSDQVMLGLWPVGPDDPLAGPLIVWRPEYSVGIEQIDEQHRRLIGLLNEIHQHLEDGKTPLSSIVERLKAVYQETARHFRSEESYFPQLPEAVAEPHRLEHEELLKELNLALRDNETANQGRLKSLVEGYLKFWLLDHIQHADSRLKEFLK